MKRIFSAWGVEGSDLAYRISEGADRPPSSEDTPVHIWTVEVGSFEEALAILNLRNGWDPCPPEGFAHPCPKCGALHYPEASGQCWRCDHVC